jgi:hypothetical protein
MVTGVYKTIVLYTQFLFLITRRAYLVVIYFPFQINTLNYYQIILLTTTSGTMKQETRKEIISLERETKLLRMICDTRRVLISNGAYSTKNMEIQELKFLSAKVPEWEKDIVRKSWDSTKKLSHSLLKRLDKLNDMILNEVE